MDLNEENENEIENEDESEESGERGFFSQVIAFFAVLGIVLSLGFIVYEKIWIPGHFDKLSSSFSIDEKLFGSRGINGATGVQEKYVKFKEEYPDFAGKFIVDGLGMDFPVVQCKDNTYYLNHTIDGKIDKHGALFADCTNNLKYFDDNTVIYGHNMKDGTQFGMLNMYKTVKGYKSGPVITFNTLYKDYKWKVFAAFLINTDPRDDSGYVFNYTKTDFRTRKEFNRFYEEVMERSYIITDVDVSYGDKILTLSTCSVLFNDSRLVVMARLVRNGESEAVNTSAAYANKDQRFPSAYKKDK